MKVENFLTKVRPGTLAIIVIVIAIAVYYLFKKTTADANTNAVNNISVDPAKLTVNTESLDMKVSLLYNAMNVAWPNCDNSTVLLVFQSFGSLDDINYVIKAFGIKPHFLNGEGTNFLTKLWSTDLNLLGWISAACNTDTASSVNAILKQYGLSL
jgi:hypothetical protein